MAPTAAEHFENLAQSVVALSAKRSGRLAALTMTTPPGVEVKSVVNDLLKRLKRAGLGVIDVTVRVGAGPPRLISAEFER